MLLFLVEAGDGVVKKCVCSGGFELHTYPRAAHI